MDEIQKNRVQTLTAEIKMLKQQTAQNIIEIGKRLIEAKESLPHGEWLPWLEKEVDFSRSTAYNFIKIAKEYSNFQSTGNLGTGHLFELLQLPAPEREDFIEENHVEEMTQRELRAAIKAKKEAEEKANRLESENNELRNTKPKEIIKTVEKEVIPKDYHSLKDKVFKLENSLESKSTQLRRLEEDKQLLEKKVKLNEKESQEYQELKKQIDLLKKKKEDFKRQIEAVTELSGLVVKVENFLKQELAPIKYSRAIEEQQHDEIVQNNLQDIISRVYNWCDEMNRLINKENHYNTEVIDYAE